MRGARDLSRSAAAVALGAIAVAGCAQASGEEAPREGSQARATAPAASPAPNGTAGFVHSPPRREPRTVRLGKRRAPRRFTARVARPARVVIPSIGVSSRLETLGLLRDGRLASPRDPHRAGWWSGGPRPGRRGAAVIAGHVDSRIGPAVFARLARLRPGAAIVVEDRAGHRLRFVVRRTEEHPKDGFPTQRVYGATRRPTLRLITCSGAFDRATGHYRSNVIVFASALAAPIRGSLG